MSPERNAKIRSMLAKRQTDLTVCLENVHKPHNMSAVVRTCDAIGVHNVHAVWDEKYHLPGDIAMGSQQWVNCSTHNTIEDAVADFKAQNMQVLVTHLSDTAVDFREIDYTKPTAILLGQEKHGATENAIASADQDIVIPMVGMVQSLNVSVAAALVLYEAQRQRQNAGLYDKSTLDQDECQRILFEGGYPRLAHLCKENDLPYPYINDEGEIEASESWWSSLRTPKP
ncbi:tRNA (guanosine(18)-2'-O)-methyltransferase TrmH [Alteromonas sp. 5E99-2]|uniref:tRNA (guanosine(18)-2'-O)-methyltransferase TrmH n=1 Tax=Alteromonas sp. 5E99-2 TaxID=2817683 RepID=UPI001A989F84|nr:tRNA (guanosine(18)-2'-O)-methyltransferase TrmH [Alteromonas sp. 5E99-2]MBO1255905.1 tRNA (guanosine(18)-2'-O)-methyltransferase TrmH [Alteromonas sp. 5E99-2]